MSPSGHAQKMEPQNLSTVRPEDEPYRMGNRLDLISRLEIQVRIA